MVWFEPATHWNEHGAVQALPSTVSDKPAGALVIVAALPFVSVAPTL